jgi:hypothetical protein
LQNGSSILLIGAARRPADFGLLLFPDSFPKTSLARYNLALLPAPRLPHRRPQSQLRDLEPASIE